MASRSILSALTGLRFLGAFHVVLYHYAPRIRGFRAHAPVWLQNFLATGSVAVDLFFVLSGFILVYNYVGSAGVLRVSKREFWSARFARVYPIYLIGFLLFTPFALVKYAGAPASVAASGLAAFSLTQAWTSYAVGWNPPGWSLSAEAFFYFFFPFFLPLIARLPRKRIFVAIGLLWLLSLVVPGWAALRMMRSAESYWQPWDLLAYNPILWLPAFLIGMLTGRLHLTRKESVSGEGRSLAQRLSLGSVILIALAFSPAYLHPLLEMGLLAPLFALLIYSLASGASALGHQPFYLLGDASYSLYILHVPLWNWFAGALALVPVFLQSEPGRSVPLPAHRITDVGWPVFLAYLAVTLCISIVALRRVEGPARRFLRHQLQPRPSPPKEVMLAGGLIE
jgi:peptidoglycan/LPS O-acetylase OafA/YrhL